MKQRVCNLLIIAGWLGLLVSIGGPASAGESKTTVDFNRDVRPILSKNCFACHGPDTAQRVSKLRLDDRETVVRKSKKGKSPVVPGSPDKSELMRRITAPDETERMPPKESGNHLSPTQIAVLKRWILEGAGYAEHWAFVKPRRWALPLVKARSWPRSALDYFILARLEKEGLKPTEEADPFTLLRRASFDLRGLPPSPEEVNAFAGDKSPDAYEKAVDRFLKDPAYGERWARMWLDLARYADSAGYGSDPLRTIWRYRDWVIDAFNRNMPYDQFTTEQIAGDLLPHATLEQRMATAFHRNTMTNTEGGTDREEFRVAAIKDRVDTTLVVWMGLTMGCAKCHNHKYDPITQQDYYRFFALFNQSADADRPDEQPVLAAPTPEIQEQIRQIDDLVAKLKRKLDTETPELVAAQARWLTELQAQPHWAVLDPAHANSESGSVLRKLADKSLLVEGPNPASDTYTVAAQTDMQAITGFRLEAIPDPSLPATGSGRAADGSFVLSHVGISAGPAPRGERANQQQAVKGQYVRVELPGAGKMLSLAEVQVFSNGANVALKGKALQSSTAYEGKPERAIDGNTNGDYFSAKSTTHTGIEDNPWWEVKLSEARPIDLIAIWNRTDGGVGSRLNHFRVMVLDNQHKAVWQQEVAEAPNPHRSLAPSGMQAVTLSQAIADFAQEGFGIASTLDAKDPEKKGWAVSPGQKSPHQAIFIAGRPIAIAGPKLLSFRLEHRSKEPGHNLGRFRLSVTNDQQLVKRTAVPPAMLAIVDQDPQKRTIEQRHALASYFRSISPSLQPIRDEIARLDKSRPGVATLPVMEELPAKQRRETHLMNKGNFLSLAEKVEPGVPAAFHPLPKGAQVDRLGVARWLMDPNNPLTARVAVNRYWAQIFGKGLVETEEDFGTQGEFPSHPELLDWLATEYIRLGWDTKEFLRTIVTSSTYRQSSKVRPEEAAKDPRNRLLGRGPRFRLEAEMVRDQALALSGLLSHKMYGPSVYPPQPPGLWQAAFNGQRTWATSDGPDRYRRGLYTFWRRTIPYPSMATFDAPSRETCTVRRIRTNTPLQAFVTLNDPVFVEAAQALARRMVREGGPTVDERARFGLGLCLARPPERQQVQYVAALFQTEKSYYRKNLQAATTLATDPIGPLPGGMEPDDLAAWTVVANVLLNLDSVLTKG